MKLRNLLTTLGLALTLGVSVGAGLAIEKGNDVKEAKADDYYINIYSPSSSYHQMLDEDGDGIFTYDLSISASTNHTFKINNNYGFSNLLISPHRSGGVFSVWSDGANGDVGVWSSTARNLTVCFRPSDQAIMIFPQGSVPTSWETFYILVNSDWTDWTDPRLNFWGSDWSIVWTDSANHSPTMDDTGRTYTGGGKTGELYSLSIPSSTTGVQALKKTVDTKTESLDISSGDIDIANFYYDSGNYLYGFKYIPDGGYLRGVYHGGEESWDENIELTSTEVEEYINYDSSSKTWEAVLDLYAGDYFKLVYVANGVTTFTTTWSITSTNPTYYPIGWSGNNVLIGEQSGVFKITSGIETSGEHTGYQWYYLDGTAQKFAKDFIDNTVCTTDGAAPTYKNDFTWTGFKDWYDTLDSYAKTILFDTTGVPYSENYIENALARYDVIVKNHPVECPAFITNAAGTATRSSNGFINSPIFATNTTSSQTATIVVVMSITLVIGVGGYFFLRKRKED